MGERSARPGRPRDPRTDEAILKAARDLMTEGGLGNLTVEGTAQRAGVAKTTVYRRYPSKPALAVAAVAALISPSDPQGETIGAILADGLERFQHRWGEAEGQSAFLALAATAASDPEAHAMFAEQILYPLQQRFRAFLAITGSPEGQDPEAVTDFAFDVLMGTLIHRTIIRKSGMDDDFKDRYTALTRFLYDTDAP